MNTWMDCRKEEIKAAAAAHKEELEQVSATIFANPELAFHEYQGQAALCALLEQNAEEVEAE